ncbi:hypothetical protein NPIL_525991 [Nephila pilipes]|uniref:DUF4817 domain-containing protein n=1 Tax=Nephila pilipes TaxID=299642 RepID=A0A8X6U9M6_NEPPI|nr:hypothetical protein NPIL_525991 [Nephila pilipes]
MWAQQVKAQCVAWYKETDRYSSTSNFKTRYRREPPSRSTIRVWYTSFTKRVMFSIKWEDGGVICFRSQGRQSFERNPTKLARMLDRVLEMTRSIVYKVLHKRLCLYDNKVQLLQALKSRDKPQRDLFAVDMLAKTETNNFGKGLFSD